MSEYLQENRRAVVMLVVALCIAALGGLYLLLGGGGADAQAEEPVPHVSPSTSPTIEPVEPAEPVTDAIVTTVVSRSNANPFTPLEGSESDANDPATPPENTPSPSPSQTSKAPSNDPKNINGSTTSDSTKSSDSEGKKPKKVDPVPKPIDKGADAEDSVPVTVLSLESDYVVARVDGDRTRLYQAVPGVLGVTYVSPLGGNCVWLERAGDPARVSVCKGTTERL